MQLSDISQDLSTDFSTFYDDQTLVDIILLMLMSVFQNQIFRHRNQNSISILSQLI